MMMFSTGDMNLANPKRGVKMMDKHAWIFFWVMLIAGDPAHIQITLIDNLLFLP